jgi:hypothetical protein
MTSKAKYLYSLLYYTSVILIHFSRIRATSHYLEEHARDVPWQKAVEIILSTKNPRKNGSRFEIDQDGYYILFEIKDKVLYIINAKRTLK